MSSVIDSGYFYKIQNGGYGNAEIYSTHEISDEDIWTVAHLLGDPYTGSGGVAVFKRPVADEVIDPA